MHTLEETKARLIEMLDRLHELYISEHKHRKYLPFDGQFVIEYGTKNARIVERRNGGGGSVYCFVELKTGDILKNAGYKAPAKGKRGSIWNDDCDVGPAKPCNLFGGGLYKR